MNQRRSEPEFFRQQLDNLPREIPPDRDLWPGIAAALARPGPRVSPWRPALAAAAVLVIVLLGAVVTLDPGRSVDFPGGQGTAWEGQDPAQLAILDALERECRQPELALASGAAILEEETGPPILSLITQNLRILDLAITETRRAWTADPDSPRLVKVLASFYRARAGLQSRAAELAAEI